VGETLKKQGFRVEIDLRNEKINYKIRAHSLQKVPFIAVVGEKEREAGQVAVRGRAGVNLGVLSLEAFAQRLRSDIATKV
jgi:threonyl-tRNA synthetase